MKKEGKAWFRRTFIKPKPVIPIKGILKSLPAKWSKEEALLLGLANVYRDALNNPFGIETIIEIALVMRWKIPRLKEFYGNHEWLPKGVDTDETGKRWEYCSVCHRDLEGHRLLHKKWGRAQAKS